MSRTWLVGVIAALPCLAVAGWAQESAAHIPVAHGTSLAGTAVALPDAIKGKTAVLLVGFSHASQGQVTNWGRLIATDFGRAPAFAYYELPILGGAPKILRGMIIKSMGKAVPESEKPHFIPLTEDDKPWRAVAHYNKSDDAYVLIVDGEGLVRWQTEGDATDAAYAVVKKKLAGMLAVAH